MHDNNKCVLNLSLQIAFFRTGSPHTYMIVKFRRCVSSARTIVQKAEKDGADEEAGVPDDDCRATNPSCI